MKKQKIQPGAPWPMKAPFPWFGGKSSVAAQVWRRFGEPDVYIEPFAGSLAVLLSRPDVPRVETVNDLDCMVANFWRALRHDPMGLARAVQRPCMEVELWQGRSVVLAARERCRALVESSETAFDVELAGRWVEAIVRSIAPEVRADKSKPTVPGKGIYGGGMGLDELLRWFDWLSVRLRGVRVLCGDWSRPVTNAELRCVAGVTAVLLDPPYDAGQGYAAGDHSVSARVREWAVAHGEEPGLRIALCGAIEEHAMPAGWKAYDWQRQGGFARALASGAVKDQRERIWFSPRCL